MIPSRTHVPLATSLALGVLLQGCGGGGGSSTPAVTNLRVVGIEIESPDPTSAHELDMVTTIAAARETENVSVSYYLIHKGDFDAKVEEPRQFLIDTFNYETVTLGTNAYQATVTIPSDVQPRGDYLLTTRIDPLDQIEESNEEDNVPPEDQPDIVIPINDVNTNTPDFTVESVTLDTDTIVLSPDLLPSSLRINQVLNKPNYHIGATAVFQVSGASSFKAVSVEASVGVPGVGFVPLLLWNDASKKFVKTLYTDLQPGIPSSVRLEILFDKSLVTRLLPIIKAGQKNFTMRLLLNAGQSIREWENGVRRFKLREDDIVKLPVILVDPLLEPRPKCLEFEQDLKKNWNNGFIGAGIGFHAGSYLDHRGAVAEVAGKVPIKIFGKTFDFFDAGAYGQLAPHEPKNTGFDMNVDILGVTVYSRQSKDPEYTYTDTPFKKVESVEARSIVMVGPVPVIFRTGAEGTLGYQIEYTMDSGSIKMTGMPYADLTARASATVELGAANGGVAGTLTLLRDEFRTTVAFGRVRLVNAGQYISGTLSMNVTNRLIGPKGRLYLFVNYPAVKWCRTFLGRVPCGVRRQRKEKTLVRFKTFVKDDVLFSDKTTATVALDCR